MLQIIRGIEIMDFSSLNWVLLAFAVGLNCGAWMVNYNWRSSARNHPRKESSGKLYWVIEDGDTDKLKIVKEWME